MADGLSNTRIAPIVLPALSTVRLVTSIAVLLIDEGFYSLHVPAPPSSER
jgi:hypothetical protein